MLISSHRTVCVRSPSADADRASFALALAAKNLRNTLTFLIRNVATSFEWCREQSCYALVAELHEHQRNALCVFNRAIAVVSAERLAKGRSEFQPLGPLTTRQAFNRALTNQTLLTRAVQLHQEHQEHPDFTAFPSAFAHTVSKQVAALIADSISARVRFFQGKSEGELDSKQGCPALPTYLGKNERCSLVLDANYLGKTGTLPQLNQTKHTLRTSFDGPLLDERAHQAWNSLQLTPLLETERKQLTRRLERGGARPRKVVFRQLQLSLKAGAVEWQLTYEVVTKVDPRTPMGTFRTKHEQQAGAKPFDSLAPNSQDTALREYVTTHSEQFKRIAGLDLGLVNHATLATSTGRHLVFSGKATNAAITRLALRQDAMLADMFLRQLPEGLRKTVEANRLQSDKSLRTPLSSDQRLHVARARQEAYTCPEYLKCRHRLRTLKSNYLHQLSTAIIGQCRQQRMQVLVIGRNKGWKDELDLGRKQNRLFSAIAHYRLIELLKYKGEQAGLVVVDSEESYTSKMSYVHTDELPTKGKSVATAPASGTRTGQIYKLKSRPYGMCRDTVHADLNGALNILRKTFPSFIYQPGFRLAFTLVKFDGSWRPFSRGVATSAASRKFGLPLRRLSASCALKCGSADHFNDEIDRHARPLARSRERLSTMKLPSS